MNLYQFVKQYEILSQYKCRCLENKEKLETSRKQYQTILPELTKQAQFFSPELRKIQADKEQRKRIQSHRLEDYWSQDQIAEYNHLLELIDFPEQKGVMDSLNTRVEKDERIEIVDSVKAGVVYKYRGDIYVIPNLRKRIRNASIAVPAVTMVPTGFAFLFAINRKDPEIALRVAAMIAGTFGFLATSMATGYVLSSSKNPFEYVASELENRVEYIKTQISF
ncbi:MAG: hypothetical protein KAT77_06175 [Nanoarchaeota archaeon]|nr:hypothetical protein [Nanoarchaeota archaeon]